MLGVHRLFASPRDGFSRSPAKLDDHSEQRFPIERRGGSVRQWARCRSALGVTGTMHACSPRPISTKVGGGWRWSAGSVVVMASLCRIGATAASGQSSARLLIFVTVIRFCRAGSIWNCLIAFVRASFFIRCGNDAEVLGAFADDINRPTCHRCPSRSRRACQKGNVDVSTYRRSLLPIPFSSFVYSVLNTAGTSRHISARAPAIHRSLRQAEFHR